MALIAPQPLAHPEPRTGRHAAPATRRRPLPVLLALAVVIGLLAGGVAVLTALRPHPAPDPVGPALDRLRALPSVTVDGYLTGPVETTRIHATVTADGVAHGVAGRTLAARAEFAVAPSGPIVRANRQWWRDEPPLLATLLADRWIAGAHDGAVDHVARLTPAALADALGALRDPRDRTTASVVVGGVPGTAYARDGLRLVVDGQGAPLAVSVPAQSLVDGSAVVLPAVRAGSGQADRAPDQAWGVAMVVRPAAAADEAAARQAVAGLAGVARGAEL